MVNCTSIKLNTNSDKISYDTSTIEVIMETMQDIPNGEEEIEEEKSEEVDDEEMKLNEIL